MFSKVQTPLSALYLLAFGVKPEGEPQRCR